MHKKLQENFRKVFRKSTKSGQKVGKKYVYSQLTNVPVAFYGTLTVSRTNETKEKKTQSSPWKGNE